MTANFDAAKIAALAITLLDWLEYGRDYAATMVATAKALAGSLAEAGMPVFSTEHGLHGQSHQLRCMRQSSAAARRRRRSLRRANILACGIGLPVPELDGDLNGLRLGTPEVVRWGMRSSTCRSWPA